MKGFKLKYEYKQINITVAPDALIHLYWHAYRPDAREYENACVKSVLSENCTDDCSDNLMNGF